MESIQSSTKGTRLVIFDKCSKEIIDRYLWATFGKSTDPNQGELLDTVWDKYYESR